MLFNSLVFFIFFILFFSVWQWAKQRDTSRWICIIFFSFVFYGWWDWRFLLLILFSGLVDFGAAKYMHQKPSQRKLLLLLSLFGNLGGLSVFKYSAFFAGLIDTAFAAFGWSINCVGSLPEWSLVVPVGISFYTFQSMSYTIDVYRSNLKPVKSVLHFFAYLTMFPQLVAGPIVRAKDMLRQLAENRRQTSLGYWLGFKLIVYGFFQKMVLADNLAVVVNKAFWEIDTQPSALFWWMVVLAFSFQIYFDFAGYSSIARGLAKWMGYRFKSNFKHPYHACSLKNFWERWHISLSTWFRDYVYIPLGGNRRSKWSWYRNMWITMILSGLWHGPALHFVVWGALHAAFLSFERISQFPKRLSGLPLGKFLAYLIVMWQVLVAWVFFRAQDMEQALTILGRMFSTNGVGNDLLFSQYFDTIIYLIIAVAVESWYFIKQRSPRLRSFSRLFWYECLSMAFLIALSVYFRGPTAEFIYFQF